MKTARCYFCAIMEGKTVGLIRHQLRTVSADAIAVIILAQHAVWKAEARTEKHYS